VFFLVYNQFKLIARAIVFDLVGVAVDMVAGANTSVDVYRVVTPLDAEIFAILGHTPAGKGIRIFK
jgi:hypothetical protein